MAHHTGEKIGRGAAPHHIEKGIHKDVPHMKIEKGAKEDRMHGAFTDHVGKLGVRHSRHHVPAGHPMHPHHSKGGCK